MPYSEVHPLLCVLDIALEVYLRGKRLVCATIYVVNTLTVNIITSMLMPLISLTIPPKRQPTLKQTRPRVSRIPTPEKQGNYLQISTRWAASHVYNRINAYHKRIRSYHVLRCTIGEYATYTAVLAGVLFAAWRLYRRRTSSIRGKSGKDHVIKHSSHGSKAEKL